MALLVGNVTDVSQIGTSGHHEQVDVVLPVSIEIIAGLLTLSGLGQ